MAEELASTIDSIRGLNLADKTARLSHSDSNLLNSDEPALAKAIQALRQSAEATVIHAQQVNSSAQSTRPLRTQDIARLSSLRRTAKELARVTETLNDATEGYIVAYITSLAWPGTVVQKIVSHFDDQLRGIARDVLKSSNDDNNVLREVLENCYGQALDPSGILNSDDYLSLGESFLEQPYDPDFESAEYYDHEDRLNVENEYAEAFRARCERECENKRKRWREGQKDWIDFWVHALSECPDGPTLFYPGANRGVECSLAAVPRYLFRAFDRRSSGRSDENVVASTMSISATPHGSRTDLLSLEKMEATKMLYRHLYRKSLFAGEESDNLMSWSSSLLFVVQYAIWRYHNGDRDSDKVKICAIDTTKFPPGQFARDMSLLRAYHDTARLEGHMLNFFDFRLGRTDYDNGEYLTQGSLNHTGRSSVVSLGRLIDAGLHRLHPDFGGNDPSALGQWTKRTLFLRQRWAVERSTTYQEIERALKMARACFTRFDATDIALLLLTFENRKPRETLTKGTFQSSPLYPRPRTLSRVVKVQEHPESLDDCGPVEVRRYLKMAGTLVPRDQHPCDASSLPPYYENQTLENIFYCV